MISQKEDVLRFIREDEWMMEILKVVRSLGLPDWWVCAGFVRSKIWDVLHGFHERTPLPDIDVIYFDPTNIEEKEEIKWQKLLKSMRADIPWSVTNEARMHLANHIPPYSSSEDAISKFPETVTALGVKLDQDGQLILTAPWGIDDVIRMEVKPTPFFKASRERMTIYHKRIKQKKWQETWPKVKIL